MTLPSAELYTAGFEALRDGMLKSCGELKAAARRQLEGSVHPDLVRARDRTKLLQLLANR